MPYTVVDKGSKYFNTVLYTGTGASNSVGGLSFSPDMVWIKNRSSSSSHQLFDSVRGVQKALFTNGTDTEETNANFLTAFNSDGFTVGISSGINGSGNSIVAWTFDANGAGVSNTAGTITSTVSANTTSGFSIVSYTGNGGSNVSVGHSLGVTPKIVLIKNRSNTSDWFLFTTVIDGSYDFLYLNLTDAKTDSTTTAPTSSFLYANGVNNTSTNNYIAYCFAEVKGFSKFGSYTGNGSADGTFVYTGFKPSFFLCKRTDAVSGVWFMFDNKRATYNVLNKELYANTADAEATADRMDFLSNGFKCRSTSTSLNASGGTYIYMCFAENPFVSSKGIPTTAR